MGARLWSPNLLMLQYRLDLPHSPEVQVTNVKLESFVLGRKVASLKYEVNHVIEQSAGGVRVVYHTLYYLQHNVILYPTTT